MRLKPVIGIILLVFSQALSSLAQTALKSPGSSEISENERTEIRKFTQDFLERLRKSRDVRPFLKTYFVKDFEGFVYDYLISDLFPSGSKLEPLSISERKRLVIAMLNYIGVVTPMYLALDMETQLPQPLRRNYQRFISGLDNDKWRKTRRTRQRFIQIVENLDRSFALYLRRHPVERTKRYTEEVRKRENIDDYNYSVITDVPDTDSDEPAAKWLRSHLDAKTYLVGTPVGLCVGVMRIKSKYKVIYLMTWPVSYDSRLSD